MPSWKNTVFIIFLLLILSPVGTAGQRPLLEQAGEAALSARAAGAEAFAPTTLARGEKLLKQAQKLAEQGRSHKSIDNVSKKALAALEKAQQLATTGADIFSDTVAAQHDAKAAEAERYAADEWTKAEKAFRGAIKRLEAGNQQVAKSRSQESLGYYREAELIAIKHNYLSETRRLISEAGDKKVSKYAPITLGQAKSLLAQAEKELNDNRYDTDKARALARQAKLQALHAFYLMDRIKTVRANEISLETFALQGETPLISIAATLELAINFSEGSEEPTLEIIDAIESLQADSLELSMVQQEYADLARENASLNERLGIQSSRLKQLDDVKRKLAIVESMFAFKEARVYRQNNNILIRLVGLNFESGKATIGSDYFGLLRKLIEALKLFPGAELAVEGHTDSFGSDNINLKLSQQRADAVLAYLQANLAEGDLRSIRSLGYGERRPVANNETAEGRRKNRRIDLLIKPAG